MAIPDNHVINVSIFIIISLLEAEVNGDAVARRLKLGETFKVSPKVFAIRGVIPTTPRHLGRYKTIRLHSVTNGITGLNVAGKILESFHINYPCCVRDEIVSARLFNSEHVALA